MEHPQIHQLQIAEIVRKYNWNNLTGAYDYLDWMPDSIGDLLAAVPKIREHARDLIEGMLFHQQTHYEGTGQTIATLITLLTLKGFPDREATIALVAEIMGAESNKPRALHSDPSFWASQLAWRHNEELSWCRLSDVYRELVELTADESDVVSYWSAKLLSVASKRTPVFPMPDSTRPELSPEEQSRLNQLLEVSRRLPVHEDDDDDGLDNPTSDLARQFQEMILSGMRSIVSDSDDESSLITYGIEDSYLSRIPEFTFDEASRFFTALEWNQEWSDDEQFVRTLLELAQSDAQTADGWLISTMVPRPLSQSQVALSEIADYFLKLALNAKRVRTRRKAAFALADLQWNAAEKIDHMRSLLRQGDFSARDGLLDALAQGAMNMKWIGKRQTADPQCDSNPNHWNRAAHLMLQQEVSRLLDSPDYRERSMAVSFFSDAEGISQDIANRIVGLRGDTSEDVRAAVSDFDAIDKAQLADMRKQLCEDECVQVRARAIYRLSQTDCEYHWLLQRLVDELDHPDPRAVAQAAELLLDDFPAPKFTQRNSERAELIVDSIKHSQLPQNIMFKAKLVEYLDPSRKDEMAKMVRQQELPEWCQRTAKSWFALAQN